MRKVFLSLTIFISVIISNLFVSVSFAQASENNSLDQSISDFMKADTNGDNMVSLEEVKNLVRQQNQNAPDEIVNLFADKIMITFDTDKDNYITRLEAAMALAKEAKDSSCTSCK